MLKFVISKFKFYFLITPFFMMKYAFNSLITIGGFLFGLHKIVTKLYEVKINLQNWAYFKIFLKKVKDRKSH